MTKIIDWLLFSFWWIVVFDDGCFNDIICQIPKEYEVKIPIFDSITFLSFRGARIAESVARLASD